MTTTFELRTAAITTNVKPGTCVLQALSILPQPYFIDNGGDVTAMLRDQKPQLLIAVILVTHKGADLDEKMVLVERVGPAQRDWDRVCDGEAWIVTRRASSSAEHPNRVGDGAKDHYR